MVSDTAKVTFIDPCLAPFTFTSETQTNPDSDKFTGDDIVFTLSPFTITPTICEITYVCTSVAKTNPSEASSIGCADLSNGGVVTDGKLIFSTD